MEISIDNFKCPSLNELMHKHWLKHSQMMKGVKGLVVAEIQRQIPAAHRNLKYFEGSLPLKVTVTAFFKASNQRDCDNLYVKPILDALVFCKLIPDDNCDVIGAVELRAYRKQKHDRVFISIQSA